MSKLKLNKSSLSQEQKALKNYKQFLPSLDLKRQKILIEKNKALSEYEKLKNDIAAIKQNFGKKLPMLATQEININDYIKVKTINTGTENIVGVNLPTLQNIEFELTDYTFFNSPHWFDYFIHVLQKLLELHYKLNIFQQRVTMLEKSLRTVTQRKNLFEKVLIPKAKNDIRTIQIFLADNERAGVVRSKITKNKRRMS